MTIAPFGWNDYATPALDAANLEAMVQHVGAYTDAHSGGWTIVTRDDYASSEVANGDFVLLSAPAQFVNDGVTTENSPTLTSASEMFAEVQIGLPIADIQGSIPPGTTVLSVQSSTSLTMSHNATANTTANLILLNGVGDAVTTEGSAVLTSASGMFTDALVGCGISDDAGNEAFPEWSTVLSVESAHSLTVSAVANASGTADLVNFYGIVSLPSPVAGATIALKMNAIGSTLIPPFIAGEFVAEEFLGTSNMLVLVPFQTAILVGDGSAWRFELTPAVWQSGSGRNSAVVIGAGAIASGGYAVAEGQGNASGSESHAEGGGTASGSVSHAEGSQTVASGTNSHAEGDQTTASGPSSHAEGGSLGGATVGPIALGSNAHAEGSATVATGDSDHSEGNNTAATGGSGSHSEGHDTQAMGASSHAEGFGTIATGIAAHAQNGSYADGMYSHAEGDDCVAAGICSHAQGFEAYAWRNYEHAESGGRFSDASPLQGSRLTFGAETTDTTPTVMVCGLNAVGGGSNDDLQLTNNTLSAITAHIGARSSDGSLCAMWELKAAVNLGEPVAASLTAPNAPALPLTITEGVNDIFTYELLANGQFTIAPGTYTTLTDLQTAVATATNSVSVPFSTYASVTNSGTHLTFVEISDVGSTGNNDSISESNGGAAALGFTGSDSYPFSGGTSTPRIVGSPTITRLFADTGADGWALAFDISDDGAALTVTGESSTDIRWVAWVSIVEVRFGEGGP